jgi:hypothetical protein
VAFKKHQLPARQQEARWQLSHGREAVISTAWMHSGAKAEQARGRIVAVWSGCGRMRCFLDGGFAIVAKRKTRAPELKNLRVTPAL